MNIRIKKETMIVPAKTDCTKRMRKKYNGREAMLCFGERKQSMKERETERSRAVIVFLDD